MQAFLGFVIVVLIGISVFMFYKKSRGQKIKRKAATYEQFLKKEGFNVSKKQQVGFRTLYVDDVHKQWMIVKGFALVDEPKIYTYSDLIEFEVLEDGESIAHGRAGNAVVGGVMFGGPRRHY
ncbi:hypothetical protein IEO70_03935 [Bacillus sp. AGMB 02131]|uniref:Uncharacterized protein n=1 Tax=Peribacillus faecalis TaxID=2772559 RepID=A0A927CU52_9BACI|nr:hypothetical protein [Peribacillus faecalis]MBD3107506.1 hypothetical protein [Peribacillus faecalis]